MSRAGTDLAERDVESALAALDAEALRELFRELLPELDQRARNRAENLILQRAAHNGTGWVPAAVQGADVAEVESFMRSAARVRLADAHEIDRCLRQGTAAFLRKDYLAAHTIFAATIPPIVDGDIDIGQVELIEDALDVDLDECAARFVVAAYMLAAPGNRVEAVRDAISEMREAGGFLEPLSELERAAVEPLPGFDEFVSQWHASLLPEQDASASRDANMGSDREHWLREAVERLKGADGLATLARSSRRQADLNAWCESLVNAQRLPEALAAYEEAAEIVANPEYARGAFLDKAALTAYRLGKKNLSPWLERAWRSEPSLGRLRRWLGAVRSKQALRKRVAEALEACPNRAHSQRALLHVLAGDVEPAAKLLAKADGLGWSNEEHPGHLMFAVFHHLLHEDRASSPFVDTLWQNTADFRDRFPYSNNDAQPHVPTPAFTELLATAGMQRIANESTRHVVLSAMRDAAERRMAEITDNQRRRHYGHAALLVAVCHACDGSPKSETWVETLRNQYRRYPALQREFKRHRNLW